MESGGRDPRGILGTSGDKCSVIRHDRVPIPGRTNRWTGRPRRKKQNPLLPDRQGSKLWEKRLPPAGIHRLQRSQLDRLSRRRRRACVVLPANPACGTRRTDAERGQAQATERVRWPAGRADASQPQDPENGRPRGPPGSADQQDAAPLSIRNRPWSSSGFSAARPGLVARVREQQMETHTGLIGRRGWATEWLTRRPA
jgi:hypothetical protein